MDFLACLLYRNGTCVPLVIGALVGAFWRLPTTLGASLRAFGSGSLSTGQAFELFEPAIQTATLGLATARLFSGTGIYVGVKYPVNTHDDTSGFPLLTTDNITLGVAHVGTTAGGPHAISRTPPQTTSLKPSSSPPANATTAKAPRASDAPATTFGILPIFKVTPPSALITPEVPLLETWTSKDRLIAGLNATRHPSPPRRSRVFVSTRTSIARSLPRGARCPPGDLSMLP